MSLRTYFQFLSHDPGITAQLKFPLKNPSLFYGEPVWLPKALTAVLRLCLPRRQFFVGTRRLLN